MVNLKMWYWCIGEMKNGELKNGVSIGVNWAVCVMDEYVCANS